MSRHDFVLLFLQISIMMAFAVAGGQLARRFRQPAVLGELLAGIVLGPTILGAFFPAAFASLFPAEGAARLAREAIITVGMLFFLFVAGLEVRLGQVRRLGRSVAYTSTLGLILPLAVGVLAVYLLPGIFDRHIGHDKPIFALFLGTALAISALPVIARTLMDLGVMQHPIGQLVMAAATIDDLVGWSLFAVLLGLIGGEASALAPWLTIPLLLLFAAGSLLIARFASRPLLSWMRHRLSWPTAFIGITAVVILASAAFAEIIGLHPIVGAYLVGVAVAQSLEAKVGNEANVIIHHFALSFFAPLYFVSIGLQANFSASFDPALVAVVIVIACLGKILGAGLGARLGGLSWGQAWAVGLGLNARGAMEIILASVALQAGLISEAVFVALVAMAVVTSMIAGPSMQRLLRAHAPRPLVVEVRPTLPHD